MELKLKIKGKMKTFKSKTITFLMFRKSVDYISGLGETFLGDGYPPSDLDEAVSLICSYFGCTKEEFEAGYEMIDSVEFLRLFRKVLENIQVNDEKRKVDLDDEGK